MYDHLCSKAEDTLRYKHIQYSKTNAQLPRDVKRYTPILASAHENGCIYLWSIQVVFVCIWDGIGLLKS